MQLAYELPLNEKILVTMYPGPSPYEHNTAQDMLFRAIMAFQPRRCLEIGIGDGDFTEAMVLGLSQIGPSKLISIDAANLPHVPTRIIPVLRNGARWEHIRTNVKQAAASFPNEMYEFIRIDCDREAWNAFGQRAPIVFVCDSGRDEKLIQEIKTIGNHDIVELHTATQDGYKIALLRRKIGDVGRIIRGG
jgi:hypothetical protein